MDDAKDKGEIMFDTDMSVSFDELAEVLKRTQSGRQNVTRVGAEIHPLSVYLWHESRVSGLKRPPGYRFSSGRDENGATVAFLQSFPLPIL